MAKIEPAMLVVLDSSDTMLETDVAPSRLERAKHKIRDLLALRSGGSTGLLVFAGSGHTAMPLTPRRRGVCAIFSRDRTKHHARIG